MKMRKLLTITLPALVLTMCAMAVLIELWVRITWDPLRGQPGLFVSDPVRVEKLAPNYVGWFAGVPLRINSLGFRDSREYALEKGPRTFRIVVIGDSVTFGHGSLFEQTYPYLLEQHLKEWQPDVEWQVWNLGVPGYNTGQELATLLDVGPSYRPDLTIIGFYMNDAVESLPVRPPTRYAILASAAKTWLRRHMYSADWYRKQYLTIRYRLVASDSERQALEHLANQEDLIARRSDVAYLPEQRLTQPQPMSPVGDGEFKREVCPGPERPGFFTAEFQHTPGFDQWKETVAQLQQLNRDGTYHIVFFINYAPEVCPGFDVFDARASGRFNEYLLQVLSDGTPAVSPHDAFSRFRPSQMPLAGGHSIGNSNALKASVLFDFLKTRVLPPLLGRPLVKTS